MSGRARPLTCCDGECARANGCRVGGYQCDRCGGWYCPDLDGGDFYGYGMNYVCADCAEERRKEADDGE